MRQLGSFLPIIIKSSPFNAKAYFAGSETIIRESLVHRHNRFPLGKQRIYGTSSNGNTNSNSSLNINTDMSNIPAQPYAYLNRDYLDLSSLNEVIANNEKTRQEAYDLSAHIKSALLHHRISIEQNLSNDEQEVLRAKVETLIGQALEQHQVPRKSEEPLGQGPSPGSSKPKKARLANLSSTFGDYVRQKAFLKFLQTGRLLPQSSLVDAITDEEYLSGIILFTNDLSRYAIGRATERDVQSVLLARDLLSSVLDYLMKYDFRNGPLRRKYDGAKYHLKTCETVLYELSVSGCDIPCEDEDEEQAAKRQEGIGEHILPEEELENLHLRMINRDDLRENLIKKCRDGQRAAKQAINALHREDFKTAEELIVTCETCVLEQLNPIVKEEPQLRYGSFASVLEEYAEAKLFYAWLAGDGSDIDINKPVGKILVPNDFSKIPLEPEDYLGGLMDLTGEIGRFAVKRGTRRDIDNVKLSLETDMSILYALESLCRLPGGGLAKKVDPLRRSVEKLEKMLYELSLVKATRRNVVAGMDEIDSSEN